MYFAARDPRVPWYAKAVAGIVVGYALSPIDLIPDFIPLLGYLDDLLLLPLGLILAIWLIPDAVWADCLERARSASARPGKSGWIAAIVIVLVWVLSAIAAFSWYQSKR